MAKKESKPKKETKPMTCKIFFVKKDGTTVAYEDMTEEEKKEQSRKARIKVMEALGYQVVSS
jgi:hypothetical protein